MRNIFFLFFMLYPVITVTAQNPVDRLPEEIRTYRLAERVAYHADNLFDYINGGAEMYLSYGLTGMKGCRYVADDQPDVTADVYEMTEAKNAFGIYTQTRDREEYTYGQGSITHRDAVMFWKDRYFVIISTVKATPQSEEAVKQLASLIDKAISGKGEIPGVIASLPSEGLAVAGYLYFHHYIWLNAYYFIADYNLPDIDATTDAVLAKYGTPEKRMYLLLVEYPGKEAAAKACKKLKGEFAPAVEPGTAIQLEDKSWFTVWTKDHQLGAIFNGSSREATEQLYRAAKTKM
ncbi:MAG: hypothetical protein LBL24_07175 [Bacteroidales bacterium]|jgi:hypothetical protein|nr:hypothetical protein [Bacteroidales bacterium]